MKKLIVFISCLLTAALIFAEEKTCSNDAGECKTSSSGWECNCFGGQGVSESGTGTEDTVSSSSQGDGNDTETVCEDKLVEICGTDAPVISEQCASEVITKCETATSDYFNKCGEPFSQDLISAYKKGEWNDFSKEVLNCCMSEDYTLRIYEYVNECVASKNLSCEECRNQFNEQENEQEYGDDEGMEPEDTAIDPTSGGPVEESGSGKDGTSETANVGNSESSSSGCALLFL